MARTSLIMWDMFFVPKMTNQRIKVEPEDDDNGASNQNDQVQYSVRHNNWTQRALGKTATVLQTLMNRQMGLPFYSRSEGTGVGSDSNEKRIGRQLVSQRAKSLEGYEEKSVKPVKVKLKETDRRAQKTEQASRVTTDWVQVELAMPEKTELSLVDTKLWKRYNEGTGGPNAKFKEEFYALDVHNFEFRLVSHVSSTGRLKHSSVIANRSLSSASTSTYLLTLTEPSYMRAYDMVKRKVSNELKLNLDVTSPPLKHYTDLDVCATTGKIFVYGTTERKRVKVVVILDYPPDWTKVGVIYVDILDCKVNIDDGCCFIVKDKTLHLTTWPFIMEKVKRIPITGKTPENSLSVKFEGRLSEMPRLINTIKFQTEVQYALFINTLVPLIYATAKTGMKFFLPIHLDSQLPPPSVYEFYKVMPGRGQEVEVRQFPDNSPRVLITTEFNQYEVVTFKFDRSGDGNVVKNCEITQPFNYWEKLQATRNAPPTSSRSASATPERTCLNNNVMISSGKKSVLGLSYCNVLDLLLVVVANEEDLMAIMYEPDDLSLPPGAPSRHFKALPPVRAWPSERNGDPNKKRESIKSVDIGFEPDFIFIKFKYSKECRPPKEMFCFQLLSESLDY